MLRRTRKASTGTSTRKGKPLVSDTGRLMTDKKAEVLDFLAYLLQLLLITQLWVTGCAELYQSVLVGLAAPKFLLWLKKSGHDMLSMLQTHVTEEKSSRNFINVN